ncbi:MAG: MFS transporter [Coriobacteriales bacterium]|jgi:EmrB/QacA subfamily drug resistance transporter
MTSKQRSILVTCLLTSFIAPFMSSALNLCITDISTDFACGATTVTWVVNAYTLCTAIFAMPMGHIADERGRKRFLVWGCALFAASSLLCAAAANVWMLIVGRVLMSIGTCVFLAGNVSILLTSFPDSRRGSLLGFVITATFVGVSLGPVIGGVIGDSLGWRWIFLLGTATGALATLLSAWRVDADHVSSDVPLDGGGNIMFMASIALVMFGLSEWSELGPVAWAVFAAGVVAVVGFVRHELRVEHPMVQLRLFRRNRVYAFANVAWMLSHAATFVVTYVIAIYLQNINLLSPSMAGIVMIAQPLAQAVFSPFAGRLSDKMISARVARVGACVTIAGVAMLMFAGLMLPVWMIVLATGVIGVGCAFFSSPIINTIVSCVEPARYSEANAMVNTTRGIGSTLSIALVSIVFSMTVGNTVIEQAPPEHLAGAVGITMIVATVIAVVSMVCTWQCVRRMTDWGD